MFGTACKPISPESFPAGGRTFARQMFAPQKKLGAATSRSAPFEVSVLLPQRDILTVVSIVEAEFEWVAGGAITEFSLYRSRCRMCANSRKHSILVLAANQRPPSRSSRLHLYIVLELPNAKP